jgi:hypothetical protein
MNTPEDIAPEARRGDGQPLHPGDGVVPIMKKVGHKRLSIIGTGFYVTRYGLLVSAKHVLQDLAAEDGTLLQSCVCHLGPQDEIYLRPIRRAYLLQAVDIGIAQADNFMSTNPSNPLQNLRAILSTELPPAGSQLITYAYPENEVLDFTHDGQIPLIAGDYFHGGFLRFVQQSEHPYLRFPYFETSIQLRPGASGGPVFDTHGRVIGVNSRGWDFQGAEHEDNPLSYIVPIGRILELDVDPFMVPPFSWEAQQIPEARRGQLLSSRELVQYGHIVFDPPLA